MTLRRGVLIGCGFFSANHLHAWADLGERARIVAVCDSDLERARAAAARFGIPRAYTDAGEMLAAERPDFADIATTAPSHRDLVEACARAGVPAIVQKPLAPSWENARALVAVMERAGLPLMVHENFRFQAPLRRVAALIAEGAIGEPVWARVSFRTGHDIYSAQPYLAEARRFVILDVGVHVLDVARVLLGEAGAVYCRTQSVRPGLQGEDMATVVLGHAGGTTSVVEMTYASHPDPDPFPQSLVQVDGREGTILLEPGCRLTISGRGSTRRELAAPEPVPWGSEPWVVTQDSVRAVQRHWLDRLDDGREPATSGRDNLRTFALVEAAYRSAASGQAVSPEVA